jgi:1-acyl-sn-glycerol-3-phosphate acyltransferase
MASLPPVKKILKSVPMSPRAALPVARFAYRLRPRSAGFPFTAPTWPTSVPREPLDDDLGVSYATSGARRYPVRMARALVVDELERPLLKVLASPEVEGDDRLAAVKGPVIFAANHASHIDTFLVLTSLPDRFRHKTVVAAGADYFFDTRLKAHASAFLIGAIPIDRTKISRRSADLPAELLRDGWNLVIFPEGGRSPDGWGHEHKGGAAYLAGRTDAPVVPIHLQGTRKVLKRGQSLPKRASTKVTFGSPMRPHDGESSRAFALRIERAIEVLADEAANGFWEARTRAATGETPTLRGPQATSWRRTWQLGEGKRAAKRGPSWPSL